MTLHPEPAPTRPPDAERPLLRADAGAVAMLTMNRPAQRNALSVAMMATMQEELEDIADDQRIRAVVIRGTGPAFCAGHDLRELRARAGDDGPGDDTASRRALDAVFRQCSRLMMTIVRLPKPVIAEVHGMATAAGCQLVASCDLAVAADDARFATPGVNIGLFCSTPMVALSRAVGRKAAMEMLLTGAPVDAGRALDLGLVNRVVPASRLTEEAMGLAQTIADKSASTVRIGKEAFYRQAEMRLHEAYDYAGEVMTRNMLMRDAKEGVDAFVEKRKPVWSGR